MVGKIPSHHSHHSHHLIIISNLPIIPLYYHLPTFIARALSPFTTLVSETSFSIAFALALVPFISIASALALTANLALKTSIHIALTATSWPPPFLLPCSP